MLVPIGVAVGIIVPHVHSVIEATDGERRRKIRFYDIDPGDEFQPNKRRFFLQQAADLLLEVKKREGRRGREEGGRGGERHPRCTHRR